MSRPTKQRVHSGATATGASEAFTTKGHNSIGMFVSAPDIADADSLDVVIEVSPDGEQWAALKKQNASVGAIGTGDLNARGNGFVFVHGLPAEYVRANIRTFTDGGGSDLAVDVYLLATNWSGTGSQFNDIQP